MGEAVSLKPLTVLEAAFVREYPKDSNGQQAAIRAGYAPGSAKVTASRLLTKPNVAAALANVRALAAQVVETRLDEAVGTEAWIIEKAGEVVNRALDAVPVRNAKGEIVEGEWTCNLSAATPALALLAKRLPAFSEKHEVSGDIRHRIEALAVVAQMKPDDVRAMAEAARGHR